jgi:hypothetical protein
MRSLLVPAKELKWVDHGIVIILAPDRGIWNALTLNAMRYFTETTWLAFGTL